MSEKTKPGLSETTAYNSGSVEEVMIVKDSITKPVGTLAELDGHEPNESIVISSQRNKLQFEVVNHPFFFMFI